MDDLRRFIRCCMNEARAGRSAKAPGGGIVLHRVGGLSFVRQAKGTAPESKGLWAFVWPYVEPFLLGSTNDRGIASQDDRDKGNTRSGQMKREGLRKFAYDGPLYVRQTVPGAVRVGSWSRVDAGAYAEWLSKYAAESRAATRTRYPDAVGGNPFRGFSKDEWEVFVPANKGTIRSLRQVSEAKKKRLPYLTDDPSFKKASVLVPHRAKRAIRKYLKAMGLVERFSAQAR